MARTFGQNLTDSSDAIIAELADPTAWEGTAVVVGTTAVEMTFSTTTKSISIQSDPDNTGRIWIGGSDVSVTGAGAVKQLSAGESIDLDLNDDSDPLYAISDTAGQIVHKLALT